MMKNILITLVLLLVLLLLSGCTNLVDLYSNINKNNIAIHEGQIAVIPKADQVTFKFIDKMQKYLSRNGSIWVEVPYRHNPDNGKTLQEFLQKK